MAKRLFFVLGLWGTLGAAAAAAHGDTIELLISLTTGNISLRNPNGSSFGIVGYSVITDPGTLTTTPGVWTSITDNYDAPSGPTPGDGSVDPTGQWFKLTSPGSTSDISESVIGPGGSLSPGQVVSLGNVWNVGVAPDPDIEVQVGQPPAELATVNVFYRHNSDYNLDLIVDRDDLDLWRTNFGTGTLPGEGDGDRDGDVDGDDFLLWQREAGLTGLSILGAGAGSGMLSVATVPEPATLLLLALGGVMWFAFARRLRLR